MKTEFFFTIGGEAFPEMMAFVEPTEQAKPITEILTEIQNNTLHPLLFEIVYDNGKLIVKVSSPKI